MVKIDDLKAGDKVTVTFRHGLRRPYEVRAVTETALVAVWLQTRRTGTVTVVMQHLPRENIESIQLS